MTKNLLKSGTEIHTVHQCVATSVPWVDGTFPALIPGAALFPVTLVYLERQHLLVKDATLLQLEGVSYFI